METDQKNIPFPLIDTSGIERIILSAAEAMEPIHASLSSILKSNQYLFGQMQEAADAMETLSKTINDAYAMTIPAIDAANDMADIFKNISQVIAPFYGISEARSAEVIARPAASEAKEIIRKRLPVKKIIVSLKLPSDIGWKNVRAKFIDAHTLFIETTPYDLKYAAAYRDMGMRNEHTGGPNMQWKMLFGLAQMGGVISWSGSEIVPAKAKKQKQLLSDALMAYSIATTHKERSGSIPTHFKCRARFVVVRPPPRISKRPTARHRIRSRRAERCLRQYPRDRGRSLRCPEGNPKDKEADRAAGRVIRLGKSSPDLCRCPARSGGAQTRRKREDRSC
ncbi:MAG TPA: hypothetical protein VIJ29_03570 [Candidatus Paceibacterota bacterium]